MSHFTGPGYDFELDIPDGWILVRMEEYYPLHAARVILSDLDRCEHGRHVGDVCGGQAGCNGPSHGNPYLKAGQRIGTDLSRRPIVVPDPRGTPISAIPVGGCHEWAPAFVLQRHQDETGVSGTGVVAEGVEFSDGTVALRWTSAWPTSVVFHDRGIDSVTAIHGHNGKTTIEWR